MPKTKRGRMAVMRNSRRGHQEHKYYDQDVDIELSNGSYNTWTKILPEAAGSPKELICAPQQGNHIYERTGRQIWIDTVKFNGMIFWSSNANPPPDLSPAEFVRIVLIKDTQVDKLGSAWTGQNDVFADVSNQGALDADVIPWAGLSLADRRYKVLKDKVYMRPTISGGAGDETVAATSRIKFKHKFLKPLPVNYTETATSGDQDAVVDNGLRLIYITGGKGVGPGGQISPNLPVLRLFIRSSYFDHRQVMAARPYYRAPLKGYGYNRGRAMNPWR